MAKPATSCEHLKTLCVEVPDFPKPGILFMTLRHCSRTRSALQTLIDSLSEHYLDRDIDLVLAVASGLCDTFINVCERNPIRPARLPVRLQGGRVHPRSSALGMASLHRQPLPPCRDRDGFGSRWLIHAHRSVSP